MRRVGGSDVEVRLKIEQSLGYGARVRGAVIIFFMARPDKARPSKGEGLEGDSAVIARGIIKKLRRKPNSTGTR